VDNAFIREVAALPAEAQVARVVAKLKELNPGWDGKVEHRIENGEVAELSFRSTTIADISPIRALAHLRRLTCSGISLPGGRCIRNAVADLTPLRHLALVSLDCAFSEVADLSPLAGMPLEQLAFQGTRVRDLSPLRGMPLAYLRLEGTPVRNFSPIVQCPLTNIGCSDHVDRGSLRTIKTLKTINGLPAAEFWRRVEAGESPQAK